MITKNKSAVFFSLIFLLALTSCAQKFPYNNPLINTTYTGKMTITASLTTESLMNRISRKEKNINKEILINEDIDDIEISWGSASTKKLNMSTKDNSLSRSKNNKFKSQSSTQISYTNGYFNFSCISHGEYKRSKQNICSFSSIGSGSILPGHMTEHGEITLNCNGETYKGIYLYHGTQISLEQ